MVTGFLVDATAATGIDMDTTADVINATTPAGNIIIEETNDVYLFSVTAPAGTVDVTTKGAGDVTVGTITAATTVDLTLGGAGDVLDDGDPSTLITGTVLTVDGPSAGAVSGDVTVETTVGSVDIEATGDVTVRETDGVTLTNVVSGGDAEITAGSTVTVVSVDATTRAAIESGGNITGGVITSPEVALEAAGSVTNIDLGNNGVTLAVLAGGDIEIDGTSGDLTVGAVDGVDQGLSGVITAKGDVTLDAAASLNVNADITAGGGTADLSALGGNITTVDGAVVTASLVDADATGSIDLNTDADTIVATFSAAGVAFIDEADTVTIQNTTGGTLDVTILEDGDILDGGGNNVDTLYAETQNGDITYVDGDNLIAMDVRAQGTGQNVTLTAGGSLDVRYVEAAGDTVNLNASGDIWDSTGTGTRDVFAGILVVDANANGDVNLDTEVHTAHAAGANVVNNVTIREETDLTVGANGFDTANSGSIVITTANGDLLTVGVLDADGPGTITLTTNGPDRDIILGNDVTGASGSIMLHASGGVNQTGGMVTTDVGVEVTAGGAVSLAQPGNAMTEIAVDTTGTVAIDDDAATGLTVGTVNGVSGIDSNGYNIDIDTAGNLSVDQFINAGSLGDVTINTIGWVAGAGDITGNIIDVTATNGIDIDTVGNIIDANGGAAGNVVIEELDDVTLRDIDSAGSVDVTLLNAGDIIVNEIDAATNVSLHLPNGSVQNDGNSGTDIAAGSALIIDNDAGGAITGYANVDTTVKSADIQAVGDVTIHETDGIILTQVTSDDDVYVENGLNGDIWVNTVTGLTSVTIDSDGAIDGTGAALITTPTVDLDADTGIGAGTPINLATTTSVDADTDTGAIDLNNSAAGPVTVNSLTTASGDINYESTAAGNLLVTLARTDNGDITIINTDGDITLGVVSAIGNDVTITAAGSGGIDDVVDELDADIFAANVDLNAEDGIGSSEAIEMEITNTIEADTTGGAIDLDNEASTPAMVTITSLTTGSGDINFDQYSKEGYTGTTDLTVNLAAAGGAAAGDGDITITNTTPNGDILIGTAAGGITALGDTVSITAAGFIDDLQAEPDAFLDIDITATTMDLNAGLGIGMNAALETEADFITADTMIGDVILWNEADSRVVVNSLTTGNGNINFFQQGLNTYGMEVDVDFVEVRTDYGHVYLRNVDNTPLDNTYGNVFIGDVAASEKIWIVTSGSILNLDVDTTTVISAPWAYLEATNGTIGVFELPIDVDVTGALFIEAGGLDDGWLSANLQGRDVYALYPDERIPGLVLFNSEEPGAAPGVGGVVDGVNQFTDWYFQGIAQNQAVIGNEIWPYVLQLDVFGDSVFAPFDDLFMIEGKGITPEDDE
jgi:hypothetical protein